MKRILSLFTLFVLLLISCSSDDNEVSVFEASSFETGELDFLE